MRKFFKILFIISCAMAVCVLYLRKRPDSALKLSDDIEWGVVFSKKMAIDMGLDWKESYFAILDDLKARAMRIPVYWQDIEPKENEYFFDDYDWMMNEAEKRNVKLTLAIGRKVPRWPECHIPDWAESLEEKKQQEKVLEFLPKIVERYKKYPNLFAWQVENEPFLSFGICPELDADFLDEEIDLVRLLDSMRPIVVTDSGELSAWVRAASRADIFGTTMYRIIYKEPFGYITYPLTPNFFWKKANIVHLFNPDKQMIISELQAEPWGPGFIADMPIEEQNKSMSIEHFRENIEYAKKVRFPEVYMWGVEWWYWQYIKHNRPEFWMTAKDLMNK